MDSERYVLDHHTSNRVYSWRVLDTWTGVVHGYGLSEADAALLRDQLVDRPSS